MASARVASRSRRRLLLAAVPAAPPAALPRRRGFSSATGTGGGGSGARPPPCRSQRGRRLSWWGCPWRRPGKASPSASCCAALSPRGLCKEPSSALEENIEQVELPEEGKSLLNAHCYEDKKIPLRGYQRSMVKSMSLASKVPHFHYLEEINCDALIKLRASFQNENKDQNVKHTFLPFLVKSLSMAVSKYPLLNSSFIEETNEVVLIGSHNIGVAMATAHGLVVPNIKAVQSLSILEVTKELARLHEMASHNRLSSADIAGGTITLSNIGAIGGKFGSPLLNLPEVAIIALGRIQKLPRFDDDGNVYPSSIINVTIGADHRLVDGATVARFCNEWKNLVEKPELLLLHMR